MYLIRRSKPTAHRARYSTCGRRRAVIRKPINNPHDPFYWDRFESLSDAGRAFKQHRSTICHAIARRARCADSRWEYEDAQELEIRLPFLLDRLLRLRRDNTSSGQH